MCHISPYKISKLILFGEAPFSSVCISSVPSTVYGLFRSIICALCVGWACFMAGTGTWVKQVFTLVRRPSTDMKKWFRVNGISSGHCSWHEWKQFGVGVTQANCSILNVERREIVIAFVMHYCNCQWNDTSTNVDLPKVQVRKIIIPFHISTF